MNPTSRNARIAGLIYLLLTIFGPVRLIYIPDTLFVHGDAEATSANIAAHEMLFRLGIASDLACAVILIFLVLALYRLFRGVHDSMAILMVIVGGVMPATLYFVNVVNDGAALMLVKGAEFLSVFDSHQRHALAMLFLRLHGQQVVAAEVLWGLWLFPLAILVLRCGFLPRFLGVWLILNGVAYIVLSIAGTLFPPYDDVIGKYTFPVQFGEVAFMLWILIMGAKPRTAAPA
ncbi:DUF4386 domain-containing protein [Dyella soli]|uniref:DUF4386 domain-containing protein n=1 Tax=Dyella soli TaxID=522319 RepID=A0A4R0YP45_9GAMM|nr:DUF4386 domain-containing protein [Dyella soli]TCI07377.1 DUF4386 domain-containing protein [Dyella soli]